VASACVLQVGAVVVCPATMAAGETYFCYASATAGQAPSELLLKSGSTTLAIGSPDAQNQGLYALTLPSNLAAGSYLVQEPAGLSAEVAVAASAGLILLEADKALYKPGQVARFRALAANTAMQPLQRNISFEVISPEGFKLVEVVRETGESGVVEFDFPIAEEPLLGRHVARAVLEATVGAGASAEASFGIEEYVLPRFEVGVVLDQSHLTYGRANSGDVTVTGKVSANFTFGEPVPGVASVTLWAPLDPWEVSSRMGGAAMDGDASIDSTDSQPTGGVAHRALASLAGLELSTTAPTPFELTIPSSQLRYGTLQAEASVVYAATGERQSSAASLPVLYQGFELQADISLSDGTKVFRPGLPLKLSVRLEKPGGQAVSAEDLQDLEVRLAQEANTVSYSQRPDTVYYGLAASGWKDGEQELEIPGVQDDSSCCNPSAERTTWKEHEEACGCCVYGLNFYVERRQPGDEYWQRIYTGVEGKSAYGCAGRAWSPDGSYLALSAPVEEGNAWRAQLTSSRPPAELQSSVEYFVTQAGTFVASGVAQPSFTASGSYYEASLQMTLPTSLSGELRFVAVARTTSGRAMAASASISRSLQLPYNLTASFSAEEVKPGAQLAVQLEAAALPSGTTPQAVHAFVTSLDRSAELLGTRAAIGKPSLLAALEKAADGAAATPVSGRIWRHCSVHGDDLMVVAELPERVQVVMDTSIAPGSDDSAYGQSLGASCPRPLFNGDFCERGGGGGDLVFMEAMAGGMPDMADAQDDAAVAERGQETAAPPSNDAAGGGTTTAVRTFFPETWIWTDIALTAGAGVASATLPVTAPDTITTWSLEAFTTSPDGISAVRSRMPLRVFKPFFVEMRLPYASVRGEDVELIIAVFNYAEGTGTLDAQLQVTLPAEVELVSGEASLQLSVPEAGAARHALRLRPKALGSFQLEASAVSGAYSDAMRKPLLVKPEGVPQHETKSVVIDLTSSSTADALLELTLPAAAVDDSARLQVTAVGDLLGPTISGLERLLQIPTGCGEQNMITLAPNVYVAKYLLATSKLTPELRQRVVNNMVVGYGRQLTYRHDDGSFSAFGKSDDSGSTWLTAFVLRVFAEVHGTGLVAVDTSVLAKAAAFLVNLQQADGSFRSVGKVIHQEMMGGTSGSPVLALTAFVTSALSRASVEVPNLAVPGLADALTSAASYLSSASGPSQYAVLLRAQALGLAGQWTSDRVASEVLDISSTADGKRFWASVGEGKSAAKDIEMTGYGLLALTSAGRLTEAFQAARWLLERRSDTGGFSSTQDTVVALNALASYATAAGQNVDVTLQVGHSGSNQESLQINAANMDVLQSFAPSVAVGANQISVSASGSGTALVTASLRYNMPDTVVLPCYDVEVNWYSSAVQACSQPKPSCTPAAGSMSIISVGLFTGYAASVKSLQSLKDEKVVKRWDLGDGTVDLYMEELKTSGKTCVQFNVTQEFQVWNVQPALSTVYDYYAPETRGEQLAAFEAKDVTDDLSSLPGIRPAPETPSGEGGDLTTSGCALQRVSSLSVVLAALWASAAHC